MSGMLDDFGALILHGDRPEGVPARASRRTLITLPWRDSPLPEDPWLAHLLPRQAYNTALLAWIDAHPPPPGCGAALFLADPFLNLARAFARLRAHRIAWIAAFPSITRFDDEFARRLDQAELTAAAEAAALDHARTAGFAAVAARWDLRAPLPAGLAGLVVPEGLAMDPAATDCPVYRYPARTGATERCALPQDGLARDP